jgi:hypothetical protein
MTAAIDSTPKRILEPDGTPLDIFSLPTDHASLEELLRDLFKNHWREITFGPIIQGAAWEIHAPNAPTRIGMLDGYLTVAFGVTHFHICIGETKGSRSRPTPPEVAKHRRTARAELYRRLGKTCVPMSWGRSALQWRERTANYRSPAQSVSSSRNGQSAEGARLVASRPVGQIARAMVWSS